MHLLLAAQLSNTRTVRLWCLDGVDLKSFLLPMVGYSLSEDDPGVSELGPLLVGDRIDPYGIFIPMMTQCA